MKVLVGKGQMALDLAKESAAVGLRPGYTAPRYRQLGTHARLLEGLCSKTKLEPSQVGRQFSEPHNQLPCVHLRSLFFSVSLVNKEGLGFKAEQMRWNRNQYGRMDREVSNWEMISGGYKIICRHANVKPKPPYLIKLKQSWQLDVFFVIFWSKPSAGGSLEVTLERKYLSVRKGVIQARLRILRE